MRTLPHVDIDAIYVMARGLCFEAVSGPVSTDDLYRAMDWFGNRQNTIEKALVSGLPSPRDQP